MVLPQKTSLVFFLVALLLVGGAVSGATSSDEQVRYTLNGTCPPQDVSGNNRDGTCFGNPTENVAGFFDDAYSFDGSNDNISTGYVADDSDGWTFEAHVKSDTPGSDAWEMIAGTDDGTNGWSIGNSGNNGQGIQCAIRDGTGGTVVAEDTNHMDGGWQHTACVWTGSRLILYINSTVIQNVSVSTHNVADDNLWIGDNGVGFDQPWPGDIDDPSFYNVALTQSEIQDLETSTSLSSGSSNPAPSLSNPDPTDNATSVVLGTDLEIKYSHSNSDAGNVTFFFDNGTQITENTNVAAGTVTKSRNLSLEKGTKYRWQVKATDGENVTWAGNHSFTTQYPTPLVTLSSPANNSAGVPPQVFKSDFTWYSPNAENLKLYTNNTRQLFFSNVANVGRKIDTPLIDNRTSRSFRDNWIAANSPLYFPYKNESRIYHLWEVENRTPSGSFHGKELGMSYTPTWNLTKTSDLRCNPMLNGSDIPWSNDGKVTYAHMFRNPLDGKYYLGATVQNKNNKNGIALLHSNGDFCNWTLSKFSDSEAWIKGHEAPEFVVVNETNTVHLFAENNTRSDSDHFTMNFSNISDFYLADDPLIQDNADHNFEGEMSVCRDGNETWQFVYNDGTGLSHMKSQTLDGSFQFNPNNPILSPSTNGFDDADVQTGDLLCEPVNGEYIMTYAGKNSTTERWFTGIANFSAANWGVSDVNDTGLKNGSTNRLTLDWANHSLDETIKFAVRGAQSDNQKVFSKNYTFTFASSSVNSAPKINSVEAILRNVGGTETKLVNLSINDPDGNEVHNHSTIPSGSVGVFSNSTLRVDSWTSPFDWKAEIADTGGLFSSSKEVNFTRSTNYAAYTENSTGAVNESWQVVNASSEINVRGDALKVEAGFADPSVMVKRLRNGNISTGSVTGVQKFYSYWAVDHIESTTYSEDQDTSESSNLSTQYIFKEKQVKNNWSTNYSRLSVEPVSISGTCTNCNTRTVAVDGDSAKNLSYNASSDWLTETEHEFKPASGNVTLDVNYTGVRNLEMQNGKAIAWSSISASVSSPSKCSQSNASTISVGASATVNKTVGFDCDPGTVGTVSVTTESVNSSTTRYYANTTSIDIKTNETKTVDIRIRYDKNNLDNWSSRNGNSVESWVDNQTHDQSVSETSNYVYITVNTSFGASSLEAGTHSSSLTWTHTSSSDNGGSSGGGGGGGGSTTDDSDSDNETGNQAGNATELLNWRISTQSDELDQAARLFASPGQVVEDELFLRNNGSVERSFEIRCVSSTGSCSWVTTSVQTVTLEPGSSTKITVKGAVPVNMTRNTEYEFRILAEDGDGTVRGVDYLITGSPFLGLLKETLGSEVNIEPIHGVGRTFTPPVGVIAFLASLLVYGVMTLIEVATKQPEPRRVPKIVVSLFVLVMVLFTL